MKISSLSQYRWHETNKIQQNTTNINTFKYNKFFSFKGSQVKPLTDEDFQNVQSNLSAVKSEAKCKNPNTALNLHHLDLDKLNGLQKGINVFDGLSMKDIGFVLQNTKLLLNRGCPNNCAHCAYMATPITNQTYDRMSFEDFASFVDGIAELQNRIGDDVCISPNFDLFLDSDCMNIEVKDKNNKTYDYIDCVDYLKGKVFSHILFDTAGWNPKSEKMQKRAEKLVKYVSTNENRLIINVSVNPYHVLIANSQKEKSKLHFIKAKRLEEKYVDRIANALFTFSPLTNTKNEINVIERAIVNSSANSKLNLSLLHKLNSKILNKLEELYEADYLTDRKVIKSKSQINEFLEIYKAKLMPGPYDSEVLPWGRAEFLFKPPFISKDSRIFILKESLKSNDFYEFGSLVNPNGSVVLLKDDISAKTNLSFNFENEDKVVKTVANEIPNFIVDSSMMRGNENHEN